MLCVAPTNSTVSPPATCHRGRSYASTILPGARGEQEAYSTASGRFTGKVPFLTGPSRVMRQVSGWVRRARGRLRSERGGGDGGDGQSGSGLGPKEPGYWAWHFWNDTLRPLTAEDEPPASLVEMRDIARMAAAQTGEALGGSVDVVRQDLGLAQAWLSRKLRQSLALASAKAGHSFAGLGPCREDLGAV